MAVFWGNSPNLNDAVNRLNRGHGVLAALITKIINWIQTIANKIGTALDGLVGGAGSSASSTKLENAVQFAINVANDPECGYDQDNRWGPDYDCSSLIYTAFHNAGFNVPYGEGYTGTMRADFTAYGEFEAWDGSYGEDASKLQRGDICVREKDITVNGKIYHAHALLYIGNNQQVAAHQNELHSGKGGKTGDQGNEIDVCSFSSMPYCSLMLRCVVQDDVVFTVDIPSTLSQTGVIGDCTYIEKPSSIGFWVDDRLKIYNLWANAGKQWWWDVAYYDGRLLIAMTKKFGSVGDKVDIYLANGDIIGGILMDRKDETDENCNEWGHTKWTSPGTSLVEFEAKVGFQTGDLYPSWKGQKVTKVNNLGSIW